MRRRRNGGGLYLHEMTFFSNEIRVKLHFESHNDIYFEITRWSITFFSFFLHFHATYLYAVVMESLENDSRGYCQGTQAYISI